MFLICSSANSLARMPATSTWTCCGIADVLLAHHVGDARGFRLEMEALDAERREFRQVEAGEDVEHHQHGDARAVRRALPDVVALVHRADRRGRFGRMRGEIFQRVQAADAAQGFHHVGGDLAGIERVAAVLGDRAQRLAQFGLVDHVAGHRRLAVRQQIALGVGAVLQLLELVLPVEGDTGGDDVAFLGGLDRGLQQGVEPHLAVVAQDRVPGVDRAGNADRMGRGQRHRVDLALQIPFGRGRHRRAAGAVIGDDLALALRLDQRKAIAADAGRLRLDHPEQRAGRDRGVRRRAARPHHVDGDKRSLRVRGRHHRVLGMDRRAAGEMEIPHRESFLSAFFYFLGIPQGGSGGLSQTVLGIFIPRRAMAGMPRERQRQCAEYAGLYGVSPARPA